MLDSLWRGLWNFGKKRWKKIFATLAGTKKKKGGNPRGPPKKNGGGQRFTRDLEGKFGTG